MDGKKNKNKLKTLYASFDRSIDRSIDLSICVSLFVHSLRTYFEVQLNLYQNRQTSFCWRHRTSMTTDMICNSRDYCHFASEVIHCCRWRCHHLCLSDSKVLKKKKNWHYYYYFCPVRVKCETTIKLSTCWTCKKIMIIKWCL